MFSTFNVVTCSSFHPSLPSEHPRYTLSAGLLLPRKTLDALQSDRAYKFDQFSIPISCQGNEEICQIRLFKGQVGLNME